MPDFSQTASTKVAIDTGGAVTSVDDLSTALGRTTDKTRKAIKDFGYLRLAMMRIATYTAIFSFFAGLGKLISNLITLELRLAEVSTLVDMRNKQSAKSFNDVTRALLQLDPHLGSAIDLTKGLYEIMSAGVSEPRQAFKLLVVSAKYAKAGLVDLATAASTLTAIMKAYGLEADDMRMVSDKLFAAVMEGKFHADELNEAIGKVIPTAAAMGVGIGEVASALAVMTQRGLDVNEASTALNRMMISFLRPTEKSVKMFRQLGWEWGRDAFRAEGFLGSLQRLEQAEKRYANLLPMIFRRQRALRGAFILSGQGLVDLERMQNKVNAATEEGGEVNRAVAKITRTVADELKATGNQILQTASAWLELKGAMAFAVREFRAMAVAVLKGTSGLAMYGTVLGALYVRFHSINKVYKANAASLVALEQKQKIAHLNTTQRITYYKKEQAAIQGKVDKFRVLRTGIIVAAVAYVVLKAALDRWIKSLDRSIDAMVEEGRRVRDLKTQYEELQWIIDNVGEVHVNLRKEAKFMRIEMLTSWLQVQGQVSNTRDLFKELYVAWEKARGQKPSKAIQEDMKDLVRAVFAGNVEFSEFEGLLNDVARGLGITADAEKGLARAMEKNIDVLKHRKKSLQEAAYIMRDWKELLPMLSMRLDEVTERFDMKQLKSFLKTIRMLRDIKDLPLLNLLKAAGIDVTKLGDTLDLLEGKISGALSKRPALEHKLAVEDIMRTYDAWLNKMAPTKEQFLRMAEAMAKKWHEAQSRGIEDMKLFVEAKRENVKIMKAVWERYAEFLPEKYREVIEQMIALLTKGGDTRTKLIEKAIKAEQEGANMVMKIKNDVAAFENELNAEKFQNIVLKTQEENELMQQKFDKQFQVQVKAHGMTLELMLKYIQQKALLLKKEEKAEEVSILRRLKEHMKAQKELIMSEQKNVWKRLAMVEKMYGSFDKLMAEWGVENVELIELLREIWKKFFDDIKTGLDPSILDHWIAGLGKFARAMSSLVAVLRDFADTMQITHGTLFNIINALDAVAKGANSVKANLDLMQQGGQEKGVLGGIMKISGAIGTAISIATTAISVFKSLFGGKSKEQKAADEAARKQREYEQTIKNVISSLKKYGDVTDSTAKKIHELSKTVGYTNAVMLTLSDIMRDTGINMNNFQKYADMMHHMLQRMKDGLLDTADGAREFGKAFAEMVKAAEELGTEGSRAMRKLIQHVLEAGIYIKEVYEYLKSKLFKAAEGLHKMILNVAKDAIELNDKLKDLKERRKEILNNIKETTRALRHQNKADLREIAALEKKLLTLRKGSDEYIKLQREIDKLKTKGSKDYQELQKALEKHYDALDRVGVKIGDVMGQIRDTAKASRRELKRLGIIAMGTFGAMLKAGVPMIEAMQAMKPALDALIERYRILGLKIPKELRPFFKLFRAIGREPEFFEAIQGLTDLVSGLGDAAMLTGDMFKYIGRQGKQYWKRLLAPREEGGFGMEREDAIRTMYPFLQKMWYQSKEQGFRLPGWISKAIKEARAMGLKFQKPFEERQLSALERIRLDNKQRLDHLGNRLRGYLRKIQDAIKDAPGAQHGLQLRSGGLVRAHAGEAIVPSKLNEALARFFGGRSGIPGALGGGEGGGMAKVQVSIDGNMFYTAILPFIREGARYGDIEVDGEGVY